MTIELTREFFGWCTLINMGLLTFWSMMLFFARGFIYRMHSKFIPVSKERFNAIHYAGMAFFKLMVFIFNLVPWIVLHILS